ncbi:hypothetical protein DPMN_113772 [Dreissena polymorpha]|uniref:Uncharacterized protein n=1 Tax=Dreissena polymorpha TaxID=45954 RepID=A0A9D4KIU3_DREPO|nr:hypothetical protein DPMN_113772 [Dreissena polymorpha]
MQIEQCDCCEYVYVIAMTHDNRLVCIRFNEEAYSEGIHASSQQYVARLTTSSPLVKSSSADTEHVKRIRVNYEQTFQKKAEFDRRENKSKADKNTEEIVESCVHRVHRNARRHLGLTQGVMKYPTSVTV